MRYETIDLEVGRTEIYLRESNIIKTHLLPYLVFKVVFSSLEEEKEGGEEYVKVDLQFFFFYQT